MKWSVAKPAVSIFFKQKMQSVPRMPVDACGIKSICAFFLTVSLTILFSIEANSHNIAVLIYYYYTLHSFLYCI